MLKTLNIAIAVLGLSFSSGICNYAAGETYGTAKAVSMYHSVVPAPLKITEGKGKSFIMTHETTIAYPAGNDDMERNADFLSEYIKETTGLELGVTDKKAKHGIRLVLDSNTGGEEAYRVSVDNHGVTISASSPHGIFYGIQTLRKSLPVAKTDTVFLTPVTISDKPRFGYRGMHFDCARHFFDVDFVKRYIDIMALHNLNTLHWHITDDQGWRIEMKRHPELTEAGSIRPCTVIGNNSLLYDNQPYGGFYTQGQAREIVRYAKERYITVIPEVDMPGHMLAALKAYPELGCTGGPYEVACEWGVFADVLCLGNEKVYSFCQDVLDELMDIFPSEYIHIGGDEAPRSRWTECGKCQAKAKKLGLTAKTLQGYFTNRIEKHVNSHGRRIIGWDEILEGEINQSATIMSWRGIGPGIEAAKKGHDVIMTPNSYLYFDYYQTDGRKGGPILIGGYVPLNKVYSFNPVPDDIPAELRSHIIGVQANLWTEYIAYPSIVEYQLLPRMAALSEVQWTNGEKDYDAFLKRLSHLSEFYKLYGYKTGPFPSVQTQPNR